MQHQALTCPICRSWNTVTDDDLRNIDIGKLCDPTFDGMPGVRLAQLVAGDAAACAMYHLRLRDVIIRHVLGWDTSKQMATPGGGLFGECIMWAGPSEEQKRYSLHWHLLAAVKGMPPTAQQLLEFIQTPRPRGRSFIDEFVDYVEQVVSEGHPVSYVEMCADTISHEHGAGTEFAGLINAKTCYEYRENRRHYLGETASDAAFIDDMDVYGALDPEAELFDAEKGRVAPTASSLEAPNVFAAEDLSTDIEAATEVPTLMRYVGVPKRYRTMTQPTKIGYPLNLKCHACGYKVSSREQVVKWACKHADAAVVEAFNAGDVTLGGVEIGIEELIRNTTRARAHVTLLGVMLLDHDPGHRPACFSSAAKHCRYRLPRECTDTVAIYINGKHVQAGDDCPSLSDIETLEVGLGSPFGFEYTSSHNRLQFVPLKCNTNTRVISASPSIIYYVTTYA